MLARHGLARRDRHKNILSNEAISHLHSLRGKFHQNSCTLFSMMPFLLEPILKLTNERSLISIFPFE